MAPDMNIRTTSKSALFLMELILSIFFFSLASTVCIQLFVKAHLLGNETTIQNHAVLWAQNIAETYLSTEADTDTTAQTLKAVPIDSDTFCLYFDKDWNILPSDSIFAGNSVDGSNKLCFTATVDTTDNHDFHQAHIAITDTRNTVLYRLDISRHIPRRS